MDRTYSSSATSVATRPGAWRMRPQDAIGVGEREGGEGRIDLVPDHVPLPLGQGPELGLDVAEQRVGMAPGEGREVGYGVADLREEPSHRVLAAGRQQGGSLSVPEVVTDVVDDGLGHVGPPVAVDEASHLAAVLGAASQERVVDGLARVVERRHL